MDFIDIADKDFKKYDGEKLFYTSREQFRLIIFLPMMGWKLQKMPIRWGIRWGARILFIKKGP